MQPQTSSQLWGKGSGSSGILNKTSQDEKNFVPLVIQFDVETIQMTSSFQMAKDKNQVLYIWGLLNKQRINKPIRLWEKVGEISCGWDHALFTVGDQMYGIGSNAYAQLGFASPDKFIDQPVPIKIKFVRLVAAGFRQSYSLQNSSLQGCGQSKKYQLGKNHKKPALWHTIYSQMDAIKSKIIKMICGKRFLLLLTENNQVYAFGCNEQNCFNQKEISHFAKPALIFREVEQVACGWAHITLLKCDGTIQSYGRNNLGQLGHEDSTAALNIKLKQSQYIQKISSGSEFTFAITNQNRLYGWGWNEHYNIIPSEQKVLPMPTLINTPKGVKNIWTNPALTIIDCI